MCPVRNSPILSETSVWAEWFLYLVICKKKKPIFTTLGMHRLLSPAVRLSPHTRESRVPIPTLASLLVFFISFSFCFPFFSSITLTNPWALERFCSLPLHIFFVATASYRRRSHYAFALSDWLSEWVSECNNRIRMSSADFDPIASGHRTNVLYKRVSGFTIFNG